MCTGLLSGSSLLFNIRDEAKTQIKLRPKQSRPCNTVSFSSNGLLAVGLDKVRNDNCLQIWNIDRASQGDKDTLRTPTYAFLPSDVISSLAFLPEIPFSLLCGSYKFLREFDLRSQSSSMQLATKCVHGIRVDPFNHHYFSSHAEDGTVSFWDRRLMRSGEPLLVLNPAGDITRGKNAFPCFRLSSTRRGEFALLGEVMTKDGTEPAIKRWQNGFVPPHKEPVEANNRSDRYTQFDSFARHPYAVKPEYLFVSSVTHTTKDVDRIVSFDYVFDMESPLTVNFICIKQSGQVFRLRSLESPTAVKFDPFNSVATVDPDSISFIGPRPEKVFAPTHELERRLSEITQQTSVTGDDEVEYDLGVGEGLVDPSALLSQDISATIRRLALKGYGMDCEWNITILNTIDSHPKIDHLRYTWRWLQLAGRSAAKGSMMAGPLDLSYEGVLGIWEGYSWFINQRRAQTKITEQDYINLIEKILEGSKRTIFTEYISRDKTRRALRQLCLRVAGWNFEFSQLEEKLCELELEGEYEKAAGWAVFHGDVGRAVQALASSKNERLRIMSTAVAGYLAYKDTPGNSPWRELCRKMASELDNPYMRAVFAFIADGEWFDVLDESTLPLHERLGIALRFLRDDELSQYLNRLSANVISHGELDGVILTGITPRAVDLLQSYVDKTCDVQTASLIISYGAPKYFEDERTTHWVECYRNLLNSWKLFSQRAMFDVARSKYSRNSQGQITAKIVPRQVYLRCNHCKKVIGNGSQLPQKDVPTRKSNQIKVQSTESSIRCSSCNHPLPRCAICLLPLGSSFPRKKSALLGSENSVGSSYTAPKPVTSTSDNGAYAALGPARTDILKTSEGYSNADKWFTFCLSCNHGMHAGHPQGWFSKHNVCPVPDCNCNCSQYAPK